jgi:hypothetical protein
LYIYFDMFKVQAEHFLSTAVKVPAFVAQWRDLTSLIKPLVKDLPFYLKKACSVDCQGFSLPFFL